MSENRRNIFLNWCWKLAALECFNLFETPVLRGIWINLIEGQGLKKLILWFLIPAQFKNFRGNFW